MAKKPRAAAVARVEEPEQLPELVQDDQVKHPQPLNRNVASVWMRSPTNDPSDGYDLLVSSSYGKDWVTLKAGVFEIDALCSISMAGIEFQFNRCVAQVIDEEGNP